MTDLRISNGKFSLIGCIISNSKMVRRNKGSMVEEQEDEPPSPVPDSAEDSGDEETDSPPAKKARATKKSDEGLLTGNIIVNAGYSLS